MALKSSRRLVLSVLVGVGLTAPSCAQWLGLDELDFSKDDGPLDAHDASTNGGRGGEETEQSGQGGATDGGARQRPADCAVAASLSCGAELACEQPCGGVLWPDGVIPFRVDTEVPSTLADRLEAIAAAWSSDRSASAAVRFARCRMPDCSEQTRFLTISLGSDSCGDRAAVLTAGPWTRAP